jgi:serine/threonine protein kinase
MAIEIAETLNHLHNERPQPVIHRDIKSSNILLSNHFQPQVLL